jgi:hypothetical protein
MMAGIDSPGALRVRNIEDSWDPLRISAVYCCQNRPCTGELWRLSRMFEDFLAWLSKKLFLSRYMYGERSSVR